MCKICAELHPTASGCTLTATGTTFDDADGYAAASAVSYAASSAPFGTLDEMADYLTHGYWGGTAYVFDTRVSNQITVDLTGLDADGQQLARWALEAWEMVADLEFVEVSSGADIEFSDSDYGAYSSSSSYTDSTGTYTTEALVNIDYQWQIDYGVSIDSYTFSTYIHEIGHALGLGHQGDYNGAAVYGRDEVFSNDSYQMSVMSYFDQIDNTTVDATYADPISAMMVDIVAIQNLYGAAAEGSETDGDTVYGHDSTLTNYLSAFFEVALDGADTGAFYGYPVAFTLYDYSGEDTIDFSTSTRDNNFSLIAETFSDIGGEIGNLGIARGTVIENLLTGVGDDTLLGNSVDNLLDGGAGDDFLTGGAGNDKLVGGSGNDILYGGADKDKLFGKGGADTLDGGDGKDKVKGNGGADDLTGGIGNDKVFGGKGADTISGGAGTDKLTGEGGADQFVFGLGDDVDRITDFNTNKDSALLDSALWSGTLSVDQVIDTYAAVKSTGIALEFDGGDKLVFLGLSDLDSLADSLAII